MFNVWINHDLILLLLKLFVILKTSSVQKPATTKVFDVTKIPKSIDIKLQTIKTSNKKIHHASHCLKQCTDQQI
ncbi:hypothetical protein GLOIN_2v510042 [Rhizophagus irregularis DAOM 181602=DAOM 197198]|uniref:Secreted protein n=1 Tax=Rhizophagus irregularis (strain DAOM 181602 / DAOM 197198 / MUCL 43194) TaxID=747089 RepID=A0A2P4PF30_RHIID|nr:hypothetical protein GLOIN_2v510042 [Rhizophagus irregularis DAOM 181602=DAOM 197198]POG63998.1 hypothetical protein GLOIN_2v510042 [Rhizophagus irregularis DAOM 181602=DAOM 197198]GET65829.1 hypothetical protein GLOIN_2v510042 [Rhizophagus irregularis DAOM 181602=DAOM 197198]|eukprot:XP_025170864.1 hypothetical protein GLOIN_2v510042 [Rhizophagus irregularis DAOM 181602=DAOM 197198]